MAKKRKIINLLALVLSGILMLSPMKVMADSSQAAAVEQTQEFSYIHDPQLNQKAMADIVVDPSAVYGFRPDPESPRLGAYADKDWSDPEKVEQWRQERIEYFKSYDVMYQLWEDMENEGKSIEEIARAVSAQRNINRINSYANDPEGLAAVKASNLAVYGDENGPTGDFLFEKYGDWETVLKKSFSSNPGMDACLGLYDERYEYNLKLGAVEISEGIIVAEDLILPQCA